MDKKNPQYNNPENEITLSKINNIIYKRKLMGLY